MAESNSIKMDNYSVVRQRSMLSTANSSIDNDANLNVNVSHVAVSASTGSVTPTTPSGPSTPASPSTPRSPSSVKSVNNTFGSYNSNRISRKRSSTAFNYAKFFDLIAKYLILICITDLSTLLLLIWIVIETTNSSLPQLNFVFLSVDCMINLISTYLQFKFANKYYLKFCGKCHRALEIKFEIKTMRNVEKSVQVSIEAQ